MPVQAEETAQDKTIAMALRYAKHIGREANVITSKLMAFNPFHGETIFRLFYMLTAMIDYPPTSGE